MVENKDLNFLLEILGHIETGVDKNDLTEIQYAKKMVNDWIDALSITEQTPPCANKKCPWCACCLLLNICEHYIPTT